MWFLYALLSALGGATIAILVKMGLKTTHPMTLTVIFFGIQFFALLLAGLFSKKIDSTSLSILSRQEWYYMISIGIISAVAYLSYLMALQQGPPCSVVAVDRLAIVFVIIMSAIFLSTPLTIYSVAGGLLMLSGAYLISC
jgi:transporter family protein